MSAATNHAENKIADGLFRTTVLTRPATWYVVLFTGAAGETGGGTEVSTSGTAYARVGLASSNANWFGTHGTTTGDSSGTGGAIANAVPITFATPTANWGNVTHWGLADASTGGNLWFQSPLTAARNILLGDGAPVFPAGSLVVTAA